MKRLAFAAAALLLALAYLLNLGSSYAPTNGDEMVYLHIARMTAESGHWLPLQSELEHMRNTKPPLLFWQAMAAGSWGWHLWTLRLPYVLETLLTAGLVGWLTLCMRSPRTGGCHEAAGGHKNRWGVGLLAAAFYLGFFATYRYGRPVLSSSIESLFLFGACALGVVTSPAWKAYPARLAAAVGLLMIPALLAKSFVLAAPVGLWLFASLWLMSESKNAAQRLWQSAWPSALAVAIGVAGFALWFAVDPDPAAVWREFVVGENFSTKFSDARSDSVLGFWLSPLVNAGLLFPLLIGLLIAALQGLRSKGLPIARAEKMLWLWVLCWLLVFTLPSQRSARYIIPAMPALAILLAMYAPRIHRVWWLLTLCLMVIAAAGLGWAAHSLDTVFPVGLGYSFVYFVAVGGLLLACAVGILSARFRIPCTAASSVAWLALLGALSAPFDRDRGLGRFDARMTQVVNELKVLVPQNFNAQFERFQFALPHSRPVPYDAAAAASASPAKLVQQAPYAVITRPLRAVKPDEDEGFDIIATRLVLRGRQQPNEVTWERLSDAKALAHLLVEREVLIGTKN
ncbi:MAG: hypothetical protein QM533_07365 [Cytophagales bacterium]|nr:hypothetical protein [Cytophagales bacterium]